MSAPGNREVAHRLFAAEFNDATYSYSKSDEERAPNYVVSPTGARINRLFAVGVLTEVTRAGDEILRARVVDPTGAFVVYAGQYQPEAVNFLERVDPPAFVAVTGKARTFQPEDSDVIYTSVRPESVNEVDADTRDRWTVGAAERTLERIGVFAAARDTGLSGDPLREALADAGVDASLAAGVPVAIEQYRTSGAYLAALQDLALDATRQVAGEVDEVEGLDLAPGEGGEAPPAFDPAVPATLDVTPGAAGTMATSTDAEEMTGGAESRETESEVAAGPAAEAEAGSEAGSTEPGSAPESDVGEAEPATAGSTGETAPAAAESGEGEPEFDAVEPGDVESTEKHDDEGPGREPAVASGSEDANEELSERGDDSDEPLDAETGEFELDEETRREVEEEFGTEFSTGSEVASPGEADIETPEPEPEQEQEPGSESEADVETATAAGDSGEEASDDDSAGDEDEPGFDAVEPGDVESTEKDGDEGMSREPVSADENSEPATDDETDPDVDLEDALVEAMDDLDDGDGAPREELIDRVAAETGADADDVEDAIQDALMSGQCYEPEDDRLKSI
jgi:RPA family protein